MKQKYPVFYYSDKVNVLIVPEEFSPKVELGPILNAVGELVSAQINEEFI